VDRIVGDSLRLFTIHYSLFTKLLTDPIADMLTRIRNASAVFKTEVFVPYSNLKEAIAKILVKEGYLNKIKNEKLKIKNKEYKVLKLGLKYEGKKRAIEKIIRVSKPGLRVYSSYKRLPRPLSGFGMAIISTSQGLMTGRQARKKKLGGEVICKIW